MRYRSGATEVAYGYVHAVTYVGSGGVLATAVAELIGAGVSILLALSPQVRSLVARGRR